MLIPLGTSESLYRFIGAQINKLLLPNRILAPNENASLVFGMLELKATHLTDYYVPKVGYHWPVNSVSNPMHSF